MSPADPRAPGEPRQPQPEDANTVILRGLQRGFGFQQQGHFDKAELAYREILARHPDCFDALHLMGILELQRGRAPSAAEWIQRAIRAHPNDASAHSNLGNALLDLRHPDKALESYEKALALQPDFAGALNGRGIALLQLKRPGEALANFDLVLRSQPGHAEAWHNRGNALSQLQRHEEALASFNRALDIQPDFAGALHGRGSALLNLKRPEEALASLDRALMLLPHLVEAHNDRGKALLDLKNPENALSGFDAALALQPDHVDALNGRGIALLNTRRLEEALVSFDRALALQPDHAEALHNRGNAFLALHRHEEALASFDRALAIKPDFAGSWIGRGIVLRRLKNRNEALASFDRALAADPGCAAALYQRGTTLWQQGQRQEAIAEFKKLLALDPNYDYARGELLHMQLQCCDWTDYDPSVVDIVAGIRNGRRVDQPLSFQVISQSAADQLRCSRLFAANGFPAAGTPVWGGERYRHDRIRLAYLSADFRAHPASYLLAGMFELHDRSRFETIALSFGPDDESEIRARLKGAFERFIDVRARSDLEVARLMRDLEIDIAVDLMGHTRSQRTGIFALRPAPVQVNYLGFPGTIGADYFDYILSDRVVIPEDHHAHYSEKVVYLPDTFQPNDRKRRIADRTPPRAEENLPEKGFVFCSFNNTYKFAPPTFDIWMRLLRKIEGSVLWLQQGNPAMVENLRREAGQRGVEADRLVFAGRTPLHEDHLARYRLADLFLDTLPFNAHTTASDALWAGLPLLTCKGDAYPGRVAASLLTAIGLPELITHSLEEYERLALELATHPAALADLRVRLARNRDVFPLFDTDRFRRYMESAYTTMWERYQGKAAPVSFSVPPIDPATSA